MSMRTALYAPSQAYFGQGRCFLCYHGIAEWNLVGGVFSRCSWYLAWVAVDLVYSGDRLHRDSVDFLDGRGHTYDKPANP